MMGRWLFSLRVPTTTALATAIRLSTRQYIKKGAFSDKNRHRLLVENNNSRRRYVFSDCNDRLAARYNSESSSQVLCLAGDLEELGFSTHSEQKGDDQKISYSHILRCNSYLHFSVPAVGTELTSALQTSSTHS